MPNKVVTISGEAIDAESGLRIFVRCDGRELEVHNIQISLTDTGTHSGGCDVVIKGMVQVGACAAIKIFLMGGA